MGEEKRYGFVEYAEKILGFKFSAFLEGDGSIEEWNFAIDMLYYLREKQLKKEAESDGF